MPGLADLVLVVEPNVRAEALIVATLTGAGYQVKVAPTGQAALDSSMTEHPAVIIIELRLPDLDGITVCRRLRLSTSAPIIVVTRDRGKDRQILALDAGADDYLVKPVSKPELLARVRVAFRHRHDMLSPENDGRLDVGELRIDLVHRAVTIGGERMTASPKEFDFLVLLARHPGEALPHDVILQSLWGAEAKGRTEYLRVLVNRLRKKLREYPRSPHLVTEPWVGYRLDNQDAE